MPRRESPLDLDGQQYRVNAWYPGEHSGETRREYELAISAAIEAWRAVQRAAGKPSAHA